MAGLFIARMANHPNGGETWLSKSLGWGMCFSTDTAMVCVSEGMTLTINIFKMNLFKLFKFANSDQKDPAPDDRELIGLTSGEIETIKSKGANLIDGKQCWELAESHKHDLEMMIRCCERQIQDNTGRKWPTNIPAPYSFTRTAIMLRKAKDYAGEIEICNKYIQHNQLLEKKHPGVFSTAHYNKKFEYRIERAKLLLEKQAKKAK